MGATLWVWTDVRAPSKLPRVTKQAFERKHPHWAQALTPPAKIAFLSVPVARGGVCQQTENQNMRMASTTKPVETIGGHAHVLALSLLAKEFRLDDIQTT